MMFAEYLKERLGVETLQEEAGFICFLIVNKDECFIQELFVNKDFRGKGVSSQLVRDVIKIAKDRGCKIVSCSVNAKAAGATHAMRVVLKMGGTLHGVSGQDIYFIKEI